MAMASSPLSGPVAFKDVFPDGHDAPPVPLPEDDEDVEALPSNPALGLRLYRGTWVAEPWVPGIARMRRFTARPGDVVLASSPKCGATWLKALAFATMARAAHPPDAGDHPLLRHSPHECVPFIEMLLAAGWGSKLDALPSPRLMATHMPYSVLPDCITRNSGCKIVYICRDPKDMVVSMWHFIRKIRPHVSFSDLFEHTCEGRSLCGPIWDHILGYWNASNHPIDISNESRPDPELTTMSPIRFLRYEELLQDTVGNVRKLARFLGQPFSAAEEEYGTAEAIVELCSFDKLSSLEVNKTGDMGLHVKFSRQSYFRKGCVGDWSNHMTSEMAHRFDAVMLDNLSGSGLAFE